MLDLLPARPARPFASLLLGVALLAPASTSAQAPTQKAGVAAAVVGSVLVAERPGAVGREVESGAPIFQGNEIRTGDGARLQIMLLDETVFTIGPSSSMVIDRFVYDPSGGSGELAAQVTKGVFRFVSGRIAKQDPKKMKVDLPSATIGIRGTSAAGRVDGARASVVLLGPGARNNAGERPGRVIVENAAGAVDLRAPRFGTTVDGPAAAPAPPELWTQARLDALTQTLAAVPRASRAARNRSADPDGTDEQDQNDAGDEERANGETRDASDEPSDRDEREPRDREARERGDPDREGDPTAEKQTPGRSPRKADRRLARADEPREDASDGNGAEPGGSKPGDGLPARRGGAGRKPGGPPAPGDGDAFFDPAGPPGPGKFEPTPSHLAGQDDAKHIAFIDGALINTPIQLPPPDEIPAGPGTPLISEFTSWDQLRSIPSGIAEYESLNVPIFGPGVGQYNLNVKINFGTREIKLDRFDGGYQFNGSPPRMFNDPGAGTDIKNYSNDVGLVNNFSDQPGDALMLPNGDTVRLFLELRNDGPNIAAKGRSGIVVREAATDRKLGGEAIAPRKDLAP